MCSQEVSNFLELPPHLPVSLWMLTRQEAYSHILENEGGMPDEMNWGHLSDTMSSGAQSYGKRSNISIAYAVSMAKVSPFKGIIQHALEDRFTPTRMHVKP